jgi:hypothetical protein
MPSFLERAIPGLGRSHLDRAFRHWRLRIVYYAKEDRLDPRLLFLWKYLLDQTYFTLREIFIENSNPDMDWSLKEHWDRLDVSAVVHVFFWMNLYILRLFKKYGAPGFNKYQDFQSLVALAERSTCHTVTMLARESPGLHLQTPKPFVETWATDDPAVLPIALFNAIYDLLEIAEKPPWAIPVLKFHLCTESAYKMSVTMLKDIPDGP